MWTKNFENLANGLLYSNRWSNGASNSVTGGLHIETPYSIVDTNGEVQNIPLNRGYTYGDYYYVAGNLALFSRLKTDNQTNLLPPETCKWTIDNLLSSGESQYKSSNLSAFTDVWLMYFGSGTNPESRDDYNITPINGIVGVGSSAQILVTKNEATNNYDLTISTAIQSTNASTINEIGVHKIVPISLLNSSNLSKCRNVLLYRKVLDTPIVLEPNQPATITLQLSLPRITLA